MKARVLVREHVEDAVAREDEELEAVDDHLLVQLRDGDQRLLVALVREVAETSRDRKHAVEPVVDHKPWRTRTHKCRHTSPAGKT